MGFDTMAETARATRPVAVSPLRHAAAVLFASFAVLALAPGCPTMKELEEAEIVERTERAAGAGAKPAKNRYEAVAARRGSSGALGFVSIPYDLWPPFDLSARFGVFDESKAPGIGPGLFGVELDARGTDPLQFYGVYAQYVQGGLNVFLSKRGPGDSGASNIGQRFFADTRIVEVSLSHDGANLVVSARPSGSTAPADVVATLAFVVTTPLNPGFGAFNIGDRAEIGFDDFELGANGTPPVPVSPAHAAVTELGTALFRLVSAHNRLDGTDAPDLPAADVALGEAATRLDAARLRTEGIPDLGKARTAKAKALERIELARASVDKVRRLLESKGASRADAAMKILARTARSHVLRAADAILPDDLRAALPGTKP
jgi:hypothetical protein